MLRKIKLNRVIYILTLVTMTILTSATKAENEQRKCSNSWHLFNEHLSDKHLMPPKEKYNGIEFRLDGVEPCNENNCSLHVLRSDSKMPIASVNLDHRDVSFCEEEERIKLTNKENYKCNLDVISKYYSISLHDEFDIFSNQTVTVQFNYTDSIYDVSLNSCIYPDDNYGHLRQMIWKFSLDNRSVVYIYEIDGLKNGIYKIPENTPYITTFHMNN